MSAIRLPAGRGDDNGLLAPESAGIASVKIGGSSGNWLTPPAGPGAPERTGHDDRQRLRDRAIIAVLLGGALRQEGLRARAILAVLRGCAPRRCAVAARADGRSSGGFTPEATGAARHANTSAPSALCLRFPTTLWRALRVLGAAVRVGW